MISKAIDQGLGDAAKAKAADADGHPVEQEAIKDRESGRVKGGHSILVNTARGSVVDETALAAALQAGHLAGAGLDVFENEPRVSADLLACPNTVLLPHLGSATSNTRIAMGMKAADNLDRFFAGSPLLDQVV